MKKNLISSVVVDEAPSGFLVTAALPFFALFSGLPDFLHFLLFLSQDVAKDFIEILRKLLNPSACIVLSKTIGDFFLLHLKILPTDFFLPSHAISRSIVTEALK